MSGSHRRDYDREEAAIRGAWHASIGAMTEEEIRSRSSCASPVAFRIAMLRRAGCVRTLGFWLDGALTLRQTERIVTGYPFDEREQLASASSQSAEVRALLARP